MRRLRGVGCWFALGCTTPAAPAEVRCDLLDASEVAAACGGARVLVPASGDGESMCVRRFARPAAGGAGGDDGEISLEVSRWSGLEFGPTPGDIVVQQTVSLELGDAARIQHWSYSGRESVSGTLVQGGLRVVVAADAADCSVGAVESLLRSSSTRLGSAR